MSLVRAIRKVLRREVLTICLVIFLADVMSGTVSPTFSLYAQELGASLTLIGALSSVTGLTRIFASMPIGVLSDRIGRKTVVTMGMLLFSASAVLYALAPNASWLFPGRILGGLAMVCTFFLGVAYVGDIVEPEERGLAFGLYASSMGLGFTVGPLLGAAIAVRHSVEASYLFAALLTLIGAGVAARGMVRIRASPGASQARRRVLPWAGAGEMLRNRGLLAGSLGNLMMSMSFGGAIANFFPVYASQLLVSQAAISSMFSARAFGSTLSRLPTGAITSRLSSRIVMYAALVLAMVALLFMAQTQSRALLAGLLAMEGVAFGTFLTAGQVFISENCTPATRGAAVGMYSTAGSLGSTVSAFVLGLIADLWGVQNVFRLTGVLLFGGLLLMTYLTTRKEEAQVRLGRSVGDEVRKPSVSG